LPFLVLAYFAILTVLATQGIHRLILLRRARVFLARNLATPNLQVWPTVTVQLPIYNEKFVVERLIQAVGALDYPDHLLEIQVLDDSSDETTELVAKALGQIPPQRRLVHLKRSDRLGFKAGALAAGLARAKGELIAIFDADFVPEPDFLRATVPHFQDRHLGMVQARWTHLNREQNWLTRVQALLLDAHFLVEHAGRQGAGLFFNFNGTAGIWRKQTIVEAGNWQHDTLTEDLDLSYRAQLAGWKFLFLPQVTCAGELPADMAAFKAQQHRWAKGSIEVMGKLLPRLLTSRISLAHKIEACFHLGGNLAYLLMVVNSAFFLIPSLFHRVQQNWAWILLVDLPLFAFASLSFIWFYLAAQRMQGRKILPGLWQIPALMALGIGLCVNNASAVLQALCGKRSEFLRTPKRGDGRAQASTYLSPRGRVHFLELVLGALYAWAVFTAGLRGWWASLPFLLLFLNGFLTVSAFAMLANYQETRRQRAASATASAGQNGERLLTD
jgi:cellulose synthase/poly-beta-1,6-N-acetylglucosamine synthase-like glycosyltransferase